MIDLEVSPAQSRPAQLCPDQSSPEYFNYIKNLHIIQAHLNGKAFTFPKICMS